MIGYKGRELYIEGVKAGALAARFKTPLYVYSKGILMERFSRLKRAFNLRPTAICYAMKANSNRSLCRLLAQEGAGAEVVSAGEIARALAAGFPPNRIVFSGVGKTMEELSLALRRGLMTINIESGAELKALEGVARRLGRRAPISIRLNPDVGAATHAYISTGKARNKFGVERAEAVRLYRKAKASPWLEIRGIHSHIGSQITSLGPYRKAAGVVAGIIRQLESEGISIGIIDVGGGMGINYDDEKPLDVAALAGALAQAFAPWPRARLLIEPGRYLTADAGVLLTRILLDKESSKRYFVVVDAGMNDLARPALYGAYHPIIPARRLGGRKRITDVVGPICESGDFLAKQRELPRCRPADILAVLKCGAYGFSMSSQYNSRPRPAEVLVDGRLARLIRRRETLEDIVRHET